MLEQSTQDRNATRRTMRKLRAGLNQKSLNNAQRQIANRARQCPQLWNATKILSYAPFEGEISPQGIIEQLGTKKIYLPKIVNYRTRSMQIFSAESTSKKNRFGILEPKAIGTPLFANQLDIILLPLVAFDRKGNRIGMGAGYYDRALQALAHQGSTRPILIGLAHHFQEVSFIKPQSWDVPLDAILTDREYIPSASRG